MSSDGEPQAVPMSAVQRPSLSATLASNAPWLLILLGLAALYGPTFNDLFRTLWAGEQQGHGPLVLALSIWLLSRKWPELNDTASSAPKPALAWTLLVLSGLVYVVGRSQDIWLFELGSLIPMLMGSVLLLRGPAQLRAIWFGLFFMLFMVPLPGAVVDALTQPMKMAVSYVAEHLLYALGYPISRTGVILQVGQYQLMVADACAGLHTLFTLEAIGLMYLNVVRHSSLLRNIGLGILIVPISFAANVIRVIVLCLITYHFGDEAGQGFLHGFAGMVLFISALALIIATDTLLRWVQKLIQGKEVTA
jgi:exosortase B